MSPNTQVEVPSGSDLYSDRSSVHGVFPDRNNRAWEIDSSAQNGLGHEISRPCKFERTTPPSCVHLGLDISTFRLGPQPGLAWV